MSYGIVRVQKMSAGSVKGIEIHDRREKNGISHTNKDIDWERTPNNYDLHPAQNENFNRAVKKRIGQLELKKAVRKDAVVMAQCLVTSDHDFFEKLSPEQTKQFFRDSYNFLCKRYGEENVISATVHMDERTPHMHFNFVPVTEDGRLSAKSLLNRTALIKQHDDFFHEIGRQYGLSRGEKDGYKNHLETAEFKKQTLTQDVEILTSQKRQLQKIVDAQKGAVLTVEKLRDVQFQKTLTGIAIKGATPEFGQALIKTAMQCTLYKSQLEETTAKIKRLERQQEFGITAKLSTSKQIADLQNQVRTLGRDLENTEQRLKDFSDEIKDTLDRISPAAKQEFLDTYDRLTLPEPEKILPTKEFPMQDL